MEIRTFETLPEAESQTLFGWGDDLFDVQSLGLQWRPKDRHFVLYEDGSPKANASGLLHGRIGGLGAAFAGRRAATAAGRPVDTACRAANTACRAANAAGRAANAEGAP